MRRETRSDDGGAGAEGMRVESVGGISGVEREAWRALEPPDFPFFDHDFLLALERSGSVGRRSGWSPVYLLCEEGGRLVGALPLYLKTDSYGEYVFDWEWAHAYREHGLPYYPKLVAAAPFTPATGPKLLVHPRADREAVVDALMEAAWEMGEDLGVSSTHALFLPEREVGEFEGRGYAIRHSLQFHWRNRGYRGFGEYLAALTGKRRRQVERERRQLAQEGLEIERLTGEALSSEHAGAMYGFYLATYDRKWGLPYLNEGFFREAFRAMRDRLLLVLAREGGRPIAGALFFHKGGSLYGRYWGAERAVRNLHFELCYYQGIEFAIERGMRLFESGAQGEHKLARGFLPTLTYSAHEIRHPVFRRAIGRYIDEEREYLAASMEDYARHDPYRR